MYAKESKKWFLFISLLAVISMVFAACSPAVETTSAGSESTAGTEAVTEAVATEEAAAVTEESQPGTPVEGGELTIGLIAEPDTLDPHMTAMGQADSVLIDMGVALIGKDEDNQYVPWAAESWEVSEDGLTYTFNLRQDMKFQDGTPLTAGDYVYTYQRAMEETSIGAASQFLAGIVDVAAPDEYTLVLTLGAPNFYLLDNLTSAGYLQPLSEAWVTEQGENFGHNPLSVGPYVMKEWITGDHITLERNPDYTWAPSYAHQGPAYFQEITYRIIPEVATVIAGLEAGELDYYTGLDVQYVARLQDLGIFNILETADQGCDPFISFNTAIAPFDDVNVRQAIGYAINRQEIIDVVLQGNGAIQTGPLSPSMTGYWPGVEDLAYTFDVEQANSLLAEAGYVANADGILEKDGQTLTFDLLTQADDVNVAQMIQEQLKVVGIEANIVQQELAILIGEIVTGEYGIALFEYGYPNGGILPMIFHSRMEGVMNITHVSNPDLDTLLDQVNNETDPAEQQEALNQVQQIIVENAYILPIFNKSSYVVLSTAIQDYRFSPSNNNLYLEDAYFLGD